MIVAKPVRRIRFEFVFRITIEAASLAGAGDGRRRR
jgi:hypothetical protein